MLALGYNWNQCKGANEFALPKVTSILLAAPLLASNHVLLIDISTFV